MRLKLESFLIRDGDLKADDISVLDLTPGEGPLWRHERDPVRFDFLGSGDTLAHCVGKNGLFATS